MEVGGKHLLELDLKVNPTTNDNIYIYDNTTKQSKRTTLGALQTFLNVNVSTGTAFSGNYNDLTNLPTLFTPTDLPTDYGVTLATVATSGDYNDLSNLPTIPVIPPTPNLATVLGVGFLSGANDISLDNTQVLTATNGNAFLNLRNGTDNVARLEATDGISLFSGVPAGYMGINIDAGGRTIVGGVTPIATNIGLSVYQRASFNNDIFSRNGVIYMYGSASNSRGWLVVDTTKIRFEIGSAFSSGVLITVGAGRTQHVDFYPSSIANYNTHGAILDLGSYESQAIIGDGSNGATLMLTASHNNGINTVSKSTNLRTFYYDIPSRNINTVLEVDGGNVFTAYNTGVLKTNEIQLTNGSVVKGENGNVHFNPRYNNIDSTAQLHADELLHISTNFRKRILIGGKLNASNTLDPTFTPNSTFQQVQIYGVNIRGNFSIGTGLASSSAIIGIGVEYTHVRWNRLYINANNGNVGLTSLDQHFRFQDIYSKDMLSVGQVLYSSNYLNRKLTVHCRDVATGNAGVHNISGILELEHNYWDDVQNVSKVTQLKHNIFTNGVGNIEGFLTLEYNSNTALKVHEDGSISLDNIPTSAVGLPSNRVWRNGNVLNIT